MFIVSYDCSRLIRTFTDRYTLINVNVQDQMQYLTKVKMVTLACSAKWQIKQTLSLQMTM